MTVPALAAGAAAGLLGGTLVGALVTARAVASNRLPSRLRMMCGQCGQHRLYAVGNHIRCPGEHCDVDLRVTEVALDE